jgi:ADP-heptose:LPS heptosyltransferase
MAPPERAGAGRRILVLKRDKLGDMLLTTPLLALLRRQLPDAAIEVLASDYNAWVLGGNPDVDRVWVYRRSRIGSGISVVGALQQAILGTRLRFERFDVAIAAQGESSPRATRRARWVGARRTIAYVEPGEPAVSDPLVPPVDGHERDRMIGLLAPLGIAAPSVPPVPRFSPPQPLLVQAARSLEAEGLVAGGYAVIGLGTRRPAKQPDKGQVLRWSEWLRREHGLDTVFMWTPGRSDNPAYPGDDDVAKPVLEQAPAWLRPFRGPLWPALGLVWHARVSIFPDSGLMHFAAASPGGVLGLFAQADVSPPPSRWAPLGPRARWLEAKDSVSELSDAAVFAKVEDLLGAPAAVALTA